MEYKILESSDAEDLSKIVNYAISDGWEPFGTLCLTCYTEMSYQTRDSHKTYAQTMIKHCPKFESTKIDFV